MYRQYVSKLTDKQLKKHNRFCLVIALGFLMGMIAMVILSLKQISDENESATFTALIPVILMPMIFIPLSYSSALSTETKRRQNQ